MAANLKTEITLTDKNFSSQLDSLCRKAQNSMNSVTQVTNTLGSTFGKLSKSLGTLGAAFGISKAAGEVFNKMMASNQTLGDAVERAQTQAGSAVNYFASCLAQADFSNFLSGLQLTISRAGELADTLDELATRAQQLGVIDARIAAKKAKAQAKYYKARTKAEKQAAVKEMQEADSEYKQAHQQFGQLNVKAARQTIKANLKGYSLSDQDIDNFFGSFQKYEAIGKAAGKRAQQLQGSIQGYQAKANSGHSVSKKEADQWNKNIKELEKLKKTKDYAYYQLTQIQDNDENSPMSKAYKNMAQYWNEEARIAQSEANTARKAAMADKYGGSGGGKGGKRTGKSSATTTTPTQQAPDYEKFSQDYYDNLLKDYREQLAKLPIGSDGWLALKKLIEDTEIELNFKLNKEKFSKSIEGLAATGDLSDRFKLTIPPIEGLEGVKGLKTAYELAREAMIKGQETAIENSQAFEELGMSFGALGNAIGGTAGAFIGALGDIAATIASTIGSIISLMMAKGVSSAMDLPFPANLAAAASVIAGLASVITTIKSAASVKYAQGGIVGGGSYVGDKQIAYVNSGEMILNQGQQGRLWNMINGNSTIGDSHPTTSDVHFVLRGADLYGSINNYRRLGKK